MLNDLPLVEALPRPGANCVPAGGFSNRANGEFQAENFKSPLEVAVEEFIGLIPPGNGKTSVLMDIFQSRYDSMVQTIKNMAPTREELEKLEERQERIEKMKRLAEDGKLVEDEVLKMLDLILSDEDRDLLEKQFFEHRNAFA